jgi:hypothetical protein
MFITNPPWSRDVLHALITNLAKQAPTWLVIDADWAHTLQAAPFQPFLRHVVSVGRVRWVPGSRLTGKDNYAWYLFDATRPPTPAVFTMRALKDASRNVANVRRWQADGEDLV